MKENDNEEEILKEFSKKLLMDSIIIAIKGKIQEDPLGQLIGRLR